MTPRTTWKKASWSLFLSFGAHAPDDRRVQQEIFTSANGAQRLEMFLQGLYPLDSKSQARVVEVALIQKGIQLIEESKLSTLT